MDDPTQPFTSQPQPVMQPEQLSQPPMPPVQSSPTPQVSQPVVPPPPKKSSKTPLLILLSLLFGILFGAGGYYFGMTQSKTTQVVPSPFIPTFTVSPTPVVQTSPEASVMDNETAAWSVYKNDQYHFQFKYPGNDDWEVDDDIVDATALKGDELVWVGLPGTDQIVFRLYMYVSSLDAQTWWQQEGEAKFRELVEGFTEVSQPRPSTIDYPTFSSSVTTVAGRNALRLEGFVFDAPGAGNVIITVLNYQGNIYMALGNKDLYSDGRSEKLYHQILSTLEFLY